MKKSSSFFKTTYHPHLLHHWGEVLDKRWLLLPYLEKGSLQGVIFDKTDPFPWPQRVQISSDVAEGLAYLHREKIVHCDLKAGNVLLDEHGLAKIADFGTVQIASRPDLNAHFGFTPAYLSPELLPWMNKNECPPFSESSDIYALGTLLWEMAERCSASWETEF